MNQPPSQPTPPAAWGTQPTRPGAPATPGPTAGVWATPPPSQQPGGSFHPYAGPTQSSSGGALPVWLAGGALVVALVALVVALVALFLPSGSGDAGSASGGFGYGEYDGTVPGAVVGQQLSGDRIAYAVIDTLLVDGSEVSPGAVQCQTVLQLDEGSAADCHGTVDGDDSWSGWVEFSGDPGQFTLYED